ncbi:hypothetical protein TL16_g10053, partial [Triparma laevis f. inornata]
LLAHRVPDPFNPSIPMPETKLPTGVFQHKVHLNRSTSASPLSLPLDTLANFIHYSPSFPILKNPQHPHKLNPPEGCVVNFVNSETGSAANKYSSTSEAFLNSQSVIINNAHLISPLANKLSKHVTQVTGVPNVYAQVYITPNFRRGGKTGAVRGHNDDRDVFVYQVLGSKLWTAYDNSRTIGVRWPKFDEQLGKNDLECKIKMQPKADNELESHPVKVGDVLYIPRGGVHHAENSGRETSIHFTIALPTSYLSAEWAVSEIFDDALTKMEPSAEWNGFCSKGEEIERFKKILMEGISENKVREKIKEGVKEVKANYEKSCKEWEGRRVEYFKKVGEGSDKARKCCWGSKVRWNEGEKPSNTGELVVCEEIEEDVNRIIEFLKLDSNIAVEVSELAFKLKVMDNLSFLLLMKVLVEKGALVVDKVEV